MVVDRLSALVTGDYDGLGLDTVRVLLPPGWRLEDGLTGKQVSYDWPVTAEVCDADGFLGQLAAFDDVGAAVGRPLALVAGTRRLRTVDLISASMLRLMPHDLRSLAYMPEPASVVPYLDLVADLKAGLFPQLSKEVEEIVGGTTSVKELIAERAGRGEDSRTAANCVTASVEQRDQQSSVPREVATADTPAKPLGKQRYQENEILKALKTRDYDPKALPRKPGKSGPKAEIRAMVKFTKKQFDHAWERLRSSGEISDPDTCRIPIIRG